MPHSKAKNSGGPVYYCFAEMRGTGLSFLEFSRGAKNLQFYEKNIHLASLDKKIPKKNNSKLLKT